MRRVFSKKEDRLGYSRSGGETVYMESPYRVKFTVGEVPSRTSPTSRTLFLVTQATAVGVIIYINDVAQRLRIQVTFCINI